ncbi:MAG: DEAD/DEAH box helicase [Cyclobacteriaceae bacterium]|nr:DEAD/DEAH box helicase [Cyclobacteriaceae bacterium]
MAEKSYIRQYISSRSSSTVRSRVSQIEVNELVINKAKKSAEAEVLGSGGDLYEVKITNYNSLKINSSCNCPYDWNSICKHEVAVLIQIDKQVNKQIEEEIVVAYSKTAPYIIKPFTAIDAATITAHSKNHYNYYFSNNNNNEENIELLEHKITLHLPANNNYWEERFVKVIIEHKDESLLLTCNCNAINRQLCMHQNYALKFISSDISPYYFNKKYIEEQWSEQLKQYGYSLKDDYRAHFESHYEEGEFIIIPKIKGLMPILKKDKWQSFSGSLLKKSSIKDYLHSKNQTKAPINFAMAIGFSFYNQDNEIPIQAKLLTGKPNKSGELASRISEIYSLNDITNINIPFATVAHTYQLASPLFLENLRNQYQYDVHPNSADNASKYQLAGFILDNLSRLLTELQKEVNIYLLEDNYYSHKITKQDIELISVKNQSTNLEFLLTEEEEFYKLECYIQIDDKKIKLPHKRVNTVNFFAVIDNVYYLHTSVDYMATLAYFMHNPVQRIQKQELKNYLTNFLIPLQKKYHVTIDINSITTAEKELDENKLSKRVYMSEVNDFVVFNPVIATGNRLLELGDNSSYSIQKKDVITYYNVNQQYIKRFETEMNEAHPAFAAQRQNNEFYLSFEQFGDKRWFLDAFEYFKDNKIEVFGYNTFKKLTYNVNRPKISVGVSSEIDWFDVSIAVSFGAESLPLAHIKKAVLKQESYIQLGDGSLGYLPEEWLKKMERYFRYGEINEDGVSISKHHFSLIDELFDEIDDEDLRKEIEEKKTKLIEFDRIKNTKIPRGVTAKMRDYQTHGFNWLVFLNEFNMGGCLADDMGLGKTLQVICLLQHQKNNKIKEPNLVVVPTSLVFNWQNEIEKFAPKLKVNVISGAKRSKNTKEFKKYDIILITYGLILRDIDYLKEYQFNYAILDESQAIKNPNSKRYKAVRLLKAYHRLVMTGTPVENSTMDLYSQMSFVNPGLLGTATFFKDYFAKAIEKDKDENRTEELKKLIKPFLIRRTKEQVATELPDKTEMILYCELEPAQKKVYNAFRDKYKNYLLGKIEEDGLGKSKMYVLEGLLKLRQICNSPALLADKEDYGNDSIKIKELLTHINENTGQHKILVFSQFVKMLDLIKKALEIDNINYEYLDGKTKNRQERVNNFQHNDKVRVFLISLKAGGTGLNLTSADYVYIVDPWWNPAVEAQAIDRCYRIGQEKHVMAYKMICKDTVEEKIVELQNRKMKMVKEIVSTDDSILKSLTKTDIEDLFS